MMSFEIWSLVATVLFGFGGIVAAWYGYKSYQASKDQLAIARDQASLVPRIELMEVSANVLVGDSELYAEVQYARQEINELMEKRAEEKRARLERAEQEKREREEQKRQEKPSGAFSAETIEQKRKTDTFNSLDSIVAPSQKRLLENFSPPTLPILHPLTAPKYVYEGPLPDHYIDIGIRNVGRVAAYDVIGWVQFDKEILEPIEHFAQAGVEIIEETNNEVKVRLSVQNPGGRLFPSFNDRYSFRLPALIHKTADTSLDYEFTSPQGVPAYGTFNLLLASGNQQK